MNKIKTIALFLTIGLFLMACACTTSDEPTFNINDGSLVLTYYNNLYTDDTFTDFQIYNNDYFTYYITSEKYGKIYGRYTDYSIDSIKWQPDISKRIYRSTYLGQKYYNELRDEVTEIIQNVYGLGKNANGQGYGIIFPTSSAIIKDAIHIDDEYYLLYEDMMYNFDYEDFKLIYNKETPFEIDFIIPGYIDDVSIDYDKMMTDLAEAFKDKDMNIDLKIWLPSGFVKRDNNISDEKYIRQVYDELVGNKPYSSVIHHHITVYKDEIIYNKFENVELEELENE